jgi:hypothetical protein
MKHYAFSVMSWWSSSSSRRFLQWTNHTVWFPWQLEIIERSAIGIIRSLVREDFPGHCYSLFSFLTNSTHDTKSEMENRLVPNGQLCQMINSEDVGWEYIQCCSTSLLTSALYIASSSVMMQSPNQMVVTSFNAYLHLPLAQITPLWKTKVLVQIRHP